MILTISVDLSVTEIWIMRRPTFSTRYRALAPWCPRGPRGALKWLFHLSYFIHRSSSAISMSSLISSSSHRPGLHCRRVPLDYRRRNRRSFDQSHTHEPFPGRNSLRIWNFIFYPMLWSSPTSLTARTPLSPRGPGRTGTSLDWIQDLIIMNMWNVDEDEVEAMIRQIEWFASRTSGLK